MNPLELGLIITAIDAASGTINKVSGAVGAFQEKFEKMKRSGLQLIVGGAELIEPIKDVAEEAGKYQKQLVQLHETLGDTAKGQAAFNELTRFAGDYVDKFASVSLPTATDALNKAYQITGSMVQAEKLFTASLHESTASGEDFVSTLQTMGQLRNIFPTENINQIKDMMFTAHRFGLEVGNFRMLLRGAAQQAALFRIDPKSLIETSTLFKRFGYDGRTALMVAMQSMHGFEQGLYKLNFPIAHTKDGMVDMAVTLMGVHDQVIKQFGSFNNMMLRAPEQFAGLKKVLGERGMTAIAGLKPDQLNAIKDAFDHMNGSADAASDAMEKNYDNRMEQFQNVWQKMKIGLGTTLLPDLTALLKRLTGIIVTVSQWTDKHKTLTKVVLEGIGLMGAALLGLGAPLLVLGTLGGPIFQLARQIFKLFGFGAEAAEAAEAVKTVAVATESVTAATEGATAATKTLSMATLAWQAAALASAAYVGYIMGDWIYETYIKDSKFEKWLSGTHFVKWIAGTDTDDLKNSLTPAGRPLSASDRAKLEAMKSAKRAGVSMPSAPSVPSASGFRAPSSVPTPPVFTSPEALSGATGGSSRPFGSTSTTVNNIEYKPVVNVTFSTSTPIDEAAIDKMLTKAMARHDHELLDKIDKLNAKRARAEYR